MTEQQERPYEIVIFGATGFTGGLTAEYLSEHLPRGARWAVAGRNHSKLETARTRLATSNPEVSAPDLLHADASDPESLQKIAESARVVVTTVGPYLQYGQALVAACAAAGTDYLDLCAESEFVDRMYVDHHATAVKTGARIIHAAGFDSIPHDLGALYTLKQLPANESVTIQGVVRTNAKISGGTLHSALGQLSRMRKMRAAAADRKRIEPRPKGRIVGGATGRPRRDSDLGTWLLPLPTIDPTIVKRTATARPDYGPDFTYSHYAGIKRLPTLIGAVAGAAAFVAAAQIPPLRRFIGKRLPQGEGPSEKRRARSFFTVDFIGNGGGQRVHTQVRGGDPGYTETSKMMAEAAMCIAYDDNPDVVGQVTTATAMGENLMNRLVNAGIEFIVIQAPAKAESAVASR